MSVSYAIRAFQYFGFTACRTRRSRSFLCFWTSRSRASISSFVGLVVHAEELLDNNKLRCLSVTEFYDYLVDSDEGGTVVDIGLEDDSNNEFLQHYVVDDASFDEFIKRDFSGIKKMRVEIELSQVKTWDIAYLANLHFDFLCISTENCMIAGVEAFQGGEGANALSIYMNIAKKECGRGMKENEGSELIDTGTPSEARQN